MLDRSVIVIGKGPSVLRSTRSWVDSFDDVAICNHVVFDGHRDRIGDRAHLWFHVWGCPPYTLSEWVNLGIRKIINVQPNETRGDEHFKDRIPAGISCEYEHFNIHQWFQNQYQLMAATGLRAIEYCIRKGYNRIGIVGIDQFQENRTRYYFDPPRMQVGRIGHASPRAIDYLKATMKINCFTKFEMVTTIQEMKDVGNDRCDIEVY